MTLSVDQRSHPSRPALCPESKGLLKLSPQIWGFNKKGRMRLCERADARKSRRGQEPEACDRAKALLRAGCEQRRHEVHGAIPLNYLNLTDELARSTANLRLLGIRNQPLELAALFYQLLIGTRFLYLAISQHNNQIRILYGRKSMGDDKRRSVSHQIFE